MLKNKENRSKRERKNGEDASSEARGDALKIRGMELRLLFPF